MRQVTLITLITLLISCGHGSATRSETVMLSCGWHQTACDQCLDVLRAQNKGTDLTVPVDRLACPPCNAAESACKPPPEGLKNWPDTRQVMEPTKDDDGPITESAESTVSEGVVDEAGDKSPQDAGVSSVRAEADQE